MSSCRKILFILISTILIFSCTNNNNLNITKFKIELISDKLISLDSLTDPWQTSFILSDDTHLQNQFFVLSGIDNSLQIYDWKTGKIQSKKILPKEGPNGVGDAGSLMVKSLDSIFVLSDFQFKLYQLDRNYNVVKSYSLLEMEGGKPSYGKGMFPASKRFCKIGFFENKVYLGGYPLISALKEDFYLKGATSLSLNLKNNKIKYLTKFPPSYIKRFRQGKIIISQQTYPSLTYNYAKKQMVISHMTDENLEAFDLSNETSNYYFAGSNEQNNFTWASKNISEKEEFKYFTKQPYFSGVYYDNYRKVYYRIFEKPNPAKVDGYDGEPWTIPSIIIINENFEKIGETEIPKEYSLTSIIIAKEGPYLRKYVPDEDKMVFTLFELVKL